MTALLALTYRRLPISYPPNEPRQCGVAQSAFRHCQWTDNRSPLTKGSWAESMILKLDRSQGYQPRDGTGKALSGCSGGVT